MKIILILIMFLGIIISDSSAYSEGEFTSPAGDKLKVTDIKAGRVLELGGNDWEFKITIVNEGSAISSGESFDALIKVRSGGNIISTKTINIDPPKIGAGKSYTVSFSINSLTRNEVIDGTFNIIMDTVQDALKGITKEFKIKK